MRKFLLIAAAAGLGTAAIAAPNMVAVQKQRHEGYEQLGRAMRQAKQAIDQGNTAAVRGAANQIAGLSAKAPGWFPAGSGPEAGKTHAKAEIWTNRADFDLKMRNFGAAAKAFQAAAAGGDLNAIKAAHGRLGQTCGACHNSYRLKDD
jgi:cytochrome c556